MATAMDVAFDYPLILGVQDGVRHLLGSGMVLQWIIGYWPGSSSNRNLPLPMDCATAPQTRLLTT